MPSVGQVCTASCVLDPASLTTWSDAAYIEDWHSLLSSLPYVAPVHNNAMACCAAVAK